MREKLGIAAFVVLLVAVWGVGFLWVRGDLSLGGGDKTAAGPTRPSASATASTSTSPSPSLSPVKPSGPAAVESYSGTVGQADERKPVDINPTPARPRPVALPPVVQFNLASFNLLGASHTGGGGKDARMASGASRINGALQLLAQHQVSVAGFQEMQGSQRDAFYGRAKSWQLFPGNTLGNAGENSIGWDTQVWELVKPQTISIPYFNGRARPMPYVLLRNKATGVLAYFANFHNPADTRIFRNQQRFRNEAMRRETELFKGLLKTGIPMFVTGDMNEREEFFCRVAGATGLKAAAGGSTSGGCVLPPRPIQIDWILGSPAVEFTAFGIDGSALVRRTTDHNLVTSTAVVDALKFPSSFGAAVVAPAG